MTRKPTILIADDSHGHLTLMDIILTSDNHEVVTCSDGGEVLTYLKDHTPDLIILDIDMPYASGLDICHRVKSMKRLKDVPVILISSLKEDLHALSDWAGADLVLEKPYPMKDLKHEVNQFLTEPVELYIAPAFATRGNEWQVAKF